MIGRVSSLLIVALATAPGMASPLAGRAATPQAADARALLRPAVDAMGGEQRLAGLQSLTLDVVGHNLALEQSERPEGPWLTIYHQRLEVRDYAHDRRWMQNQQRSWVNPSWSTPMAQVAAGDVSAMAVTAQGTMRWARGAPALVKTKDETFALAPERVLLTARAAADLRAQPDATEQRVRQNVLAFTWRELRVRLYLNAWTHLPTMVEVVRPDSIWGDETERRWFSFWTLEHGGLLYPRQTSVEVNGQPSGDDTVQTLVVDGEIDEAKFAIPDDVRAAAQAAPPAAGLPGLHVDESRVVALTDWLAQVPGGFNVEFVRQPDGLVIVEATTTSAYSEEILKLAAARYPGVPIKAVVTTSDAWPHIGGIREYVARGIPIYALDLNVAILSRLIAAPRTIEPDALARRPRTPLFHPVSTRTAIGTGDTRIELLPVRGETGERMMIAWLPGAHALYSSDLIQRTRQPGTFFMPEMLMETRATVAREGITGIERVFGMHLPPTPWADVLAAIDAAVR